MSTAPKYLSIPPFISAPWDQVSSLHMEEQTLCITLRNGQLVKVPQLNDTQLSQIFGDHAAYLNGSESTPVSSQPDTPKRVDGGGMGTLNPGMFSGFRLGLGNMAGLEQALQHNSELGSAPDLPSDMLDKIAGVAKIMAPGEIDQMPKGEPHCNCPYCQIARAIHGEGFHTGMAEESEPAIDDEELSFREWDISQKDDNLYQVVNPLNQEERYSVFLGDPVGCTCGQSNCEHIVAVLRS